MLRQLKKRTLREGARRAAAERVETNNAIIWQILTSERKCRVKVQGSNTLLDARYPENWQQAPEWLKPGNAVTVLHRGGNRNRLEIIGHGIAIPTPIDDGQEITPILDASPDAVLTGCQIYSLPDTEAMQVYIVTGTYRINGTQYALDEMAMDETNVVTMGSGIPMGTTVDVLAVNAAHATLFRMDGFFIGTDGVIDYVAGTPHATNPQIPATPSNHVRIGWVYVPAGTTAISQQLINRPFVAPFVAQLTVAVSQELLTWEDSSATYTCQVLDQYGRGITGTSWGIKATIQIGSGHLGTVAELTTRTLYTGTSSSSVVFTYYRETGYDDPITPAEETGPIFIYFELVQNTDILMIALARIENEFGEEII